jgi:hypothetical protein
MVASWVEMSGDKKVAWTVETTAGVTAFEMVDR